MTFEEFSDELDKPKQEVIDDMKLAVDKLKLKYDKINQTSYYTDELAKSFPLGRVGFENARLSKLRDRDLQKTIDNAISSINIKKEIEVLENRIKAYSVGKVQANGNPKAPSLLKLNARIEAAEKMLNSGMLTKGEKLNDEDRGNLKDTIAHYKKQRRDKEKKHRELYEKVSK